MAGGIEHVPSGRKLFLKGLNKITAFIESYLPGIDEILWRIKSWAFAAAVVLCSVAFVGGCSLTGAPLPKQKDPPVVETPVALPPPPHCAAGSLAEFPWPNPPQPSVTAPIPLYLLFEKDSDAKKLADVGRRLSGLVAEAGYLQPIYLGAGCNGFAIVLDLEHIEAHGTRKPGTAGFGPSNQKQGFSLSDYILRLFYAPPGYYRQIVFVVSDEGMAGTTAPPTESELRSMAKDGSSALPPDFETVPYTWQHKIMALIYEFEKGPGDGGTRLIAPTGRLGATVHLKKAKLYRGAGGD
jgi:hypothetical protein